MLNKALLACSNALNEFTEALAAECRRNGHVIVTARDGMMFEVYFCDANKDNNEHPFFIL